MHNLDTIPSTLEFDPFTYSIYRIALIRGQQRRAARPARPALREAPRLNVRPPVRRLGRRAVGRVRVRRRQRDIGRRHVLHRVALLRVVVDVAIHSGAAQDRLDELVLPERFAEVVVHLRGEALFAVADHGVGRESDDGCRRDDVVALPFADLGRGFEAALCDVR